MMNDLYSFDGDGKDAQDTYNVGFYRELSKL